MDKNPFSPLWQLRCTCRQQSQCCVHLPVIKEAKIWPMAPVPEPPVNQVSFPAPFSAVLCHWWDGGNHHLRPWSLNQSPQCPEVPFDGPGTSLCYFVPANLHYQEGVIIRRLHQIREFLGNIPDPGPRQQSPLHCNSLSITHSACPISLQTPCDASQYAVQAHQIKAHLKAQEHIACWHLTCQWLRLRCGDSWADLIDEKKNKKIRGTPCSSACWALHVSQINQERDDLTNHPTHFLWDSELLF